MGKHPDLQIAKVRLTFIGDSDRDRSGLPEATKKIAIDHSVKALVELTPEAPGPPGVMSSWLIISTPAGQAWS